MNTLDLVVTRLADHGIVMTRQEVYSFRGFLRPLSMSSLQVCLEDSVLNINVCTKCTLFRQNIFSSHKLRSFIVAIFFQDDISLLPTLTPPRANKRMPHMWKVFSILDTCKIMSVEFMLTTLMLVSFAGQLRVRHR